MREFQVGILALAAGLASVPARAVDAYTIDPRHSFPSFEIGHFGWSTQRGRFDKTSGRFTLDRVAKTGAVEVAIDAASVDTGVAARDEDLRGEGFFDVAKYAAMTFKSTRVRFEGDKPVAVDGELTLRGVTRPLTLTVTNFHCGPNPFVKKEVCGADAVATIKRSEFGMTKFLPAISDEVKLLINVEAIKD
ncbi:MAG TPA: YceI family protein [Burkholderiales bacterium]|nr:YceI family protein [Burkholderiales bacterium]